MIQPAVGTLLRVDKANILFSFDKSEEPGEEFSITVIGFLRPEDFILILEHDSPYYGYTKILANETVGYIYRR